MCGTFAGALAYAMRIRVEPGSHRCAPIYVSDLFNLILFDLGRALLTNDDVNQDAESTFEIIWLFVSEEVAYHYDAQDEKYDVEDFEVKALQEVRDASRKGTRGPDKYHILAYAPAHDNN